MLLMGAYSRGTRDTRIMIRHGSGKNTEKFAILRGGAAQGAAVTTDYPDLAAVIQSWHSLPDAVKTGILAMVHAAS